MVKTCLMKWKVFARHADTNKIIRLHHVSTPKNEQNIHTHTHTHTQTLLTPHLLVNNSDNNNHKIIETNKKESRKTTQSE